MEAEEKERLLEQSNILRKQLKAWEKEFAANNGGRKASRDDIKENRSIAEKYKEYNRARDILSGKISLQSQSTPVKRTSKKRKHELPKAQTPSKRQQLTRTPSKPSSHPADIDPYDSPSIIRNLFSPSKVTSIGPTPQKDGQALGLFDLLPSGDEATPTKGENTPKKGIGSNVQATPSKPRSEMMGTPATNRHSRTPASSGKRFLLNTFATPLKRRSPNEQASKTPGSVSKLHFSTPAFLRRDSQRPPMSTIDESTEISPELVRPPSRRPLVRGLSSILAGLRKMEEEAADDDLDALHEMEMHNDVTVAAPKNNVPEAAVLVEDSQARPALLGGFDDGAMYDSEPEEVKTAVLGPDGQPAKVWKKKGQKRTTRRVVMKPVRSKPLARARTGNPEDDNDDADELSTPVPNEETIRDTQSLDPNALAVAIEDAEPPDDSASEYAGSEQGSDTQETKTTTAITKSTSNKGKGKEKSKPEGNTKKISTASKKVSAMAHQNFKRLKLRNSGARGGPAHNSRFRRRR